MPDYKAEIQGPPRMEAYLWCAEPAEDNDDPLVLRPHGWRLSISYFDNKMSDDEPVRITWLMTIQEILQQMNLYWPEEPIWTRLDTSEVVDLHGLAGIRWSNSNS